MDEEKVVLEAEEKVEEAAEEVKEADKKEELQKKAAEFAENAKEKATELGAKVVEGAKDLGEKFAATNAGKSLLGEDGKLGKDDFQRIGTAVKDGATELVEKVKELVKK